MGVKSFIQGCLRVFRLTKKPTNTEFKIIVKVSGLGLAVIGVIGFIIQLFKQLIFK